MDHRKGKDRKFEVLVKWETGEETWEPLRIMIKEDPITMASYAAEHNLLDQDQWKCLRPYHHQQKYIMKTIKRRFCIVKF